MDNFVRRVCSVFLQGIEGILDALCRGMTCPDAEVMIKACCDGLATSLYSAYIEEVNRQLHDNPKAREGWNVVRTDKRSISSLMGEVKFSRAYYRNKETGEHRYLSDDVCGITPHSRLTPAFRAKLVENAGKMAYGETGRRTGSCEVSDQTVMNSLRKLEFDPAWVKGVVSAGKKRRVPVLYVEADEDHLSGNRNKRKRLEPKLVYVHEGREKVGTKRYALINPKYFGGMYNDPDELWWAVHRYIEQTYDVDALLMVFVTGDGARWITLGTEFVEKGVRLPDLFHLRKYIVAASHGDKALASKLWRAVDAADKAKTRELLDEAGSTAVTKGQANSVARCRTYLCNMWGAVQNRRKHLREAAGCSAEGHVSHVYAARMSSRPTSWSETGADIMARLRIMMANGESISDHALRQATRSLEDIQIGRERVQEIRSGVRTKVKAVEGYLHAQLGNMPILQGKTSFTARALRGLRDYMAI